MSCATCIYSVPQELGPQDDLRAPRKMQCRRFPPVVIGSFLPTQTGQLVTPTATVYPTVQDDMSCGEWDNGTDAH